MPNSVTSNVQYALLVETSGLAARDAHCIYPSVVQSIFPVCLHNLLSFSILYHYFLADNN